VAAKNAKQRQKSKKLRKLNVCMPLEYLICIFPLINKRIAGIPERFHR